MKNQFTLARTAACLLLAMAGVHAHAHAAQASQAAAADPQAAVPATRYQSALQTPPASAADASPDRNWVASNQKAAATNSMALTMKAGMTGMAGMAGMAGMDMDKQASPGMCTPGGAGGGEGMQCMGADKAGQGKMACCAACPCMNKAKDAAAPAPAPAPDPHAHHHQETQ
jgi:hypothetical protein